MRLGWIFVVAACQHGAVPATGPSCTAAAAHVRSLLGPERARTDKIHDAFVRRCEADAWSPDARACMVATRSLEAPRHCKAKLTGAQRGALDRDLAVIAAASAAAMPQACNDYRGMVALRGCPFSEPARAALEQVYRELAVAWARGMYDTAAFESQCESMLVGLLQAIATNCGR